MRSLTTKHPLAPRWHPAQHLSSDISIPSAPVPESALGTLARSLMAVDVTIESIPDQASPTQSPPKIRSSNPAQMRWGASHNPTQSHYPGSASSMDHPRAP